MVEDLCKMSWFLIMGLVVVVVSQSTAQQIPKTAFSCENRATGYYADVTTGCQVYHMCDGLGRKFSYMCPNATLFQQRMMICDHWFMVNCSRSEENYDANLLIGQRGIPFIDDSTFSRTPRPDFLHPNQADANIGYRKGKSRTEETKNLVGVIEDSQAIDTNTDDPSYFPPSHWSTEYPSQPTTLSPGRSPDQQLPPKSQQPPSRNQQQPPRSQQFENRRQSFNSRESDNSGQQFDNSRQQFDNSRQQFDNSRQQFDNNRQQSDNNRQQSVNGQQFDNNRGPSFNNQQPNILPQKYYRTNYNTVNKSGVGTDVSNSNVNKAIGNGSKAKAIDFNSVNRNSNSFDSGIQKQTGKPFSIPSSKEQTVQVNFRSNFKATTPVYPTSVELTSVGNSFDSGIQKQTGKSFSIPSSKEQTVQVNFRSNFKATTPVYPTSVELTSVGNSFDSGIQKQTGKPFSIPSSKEQTVQVNFRSNFKATTPVYPTSVELTSVAPDDAGVLPPVDPTSNVEENSIVNFRSNFKATTPQYPTSVEATSPDPGEAGLLPPNSRAESQEQDSANEANHIPETHEVPINTEFEPPKFDESYKNRGSPGTTLPPISEYFQPPKFDYENTKNKASLDSKINGNNLKSPPDWSLTMKPEQWRDLRDQLHIPDYDFPLDPATRPSYESDFNSFQSDGDKKGQKK